MPLYEFECKKCNEELEIVVGLENEDPPCPECGGELLKLISAPNIIRMAPQTGLIYSDKQIESSHGTDWRRTTKTDRPGGDRKALYFDQK